ncbi:uncharacterized protein LOC143449868 [Clavelina lepadiformis]|uniref:uncharacterized protein LOC143449868 n=1 Tax=Clavelina lepadiformis TaxID=159417 RepID=UPI00404329DD
MKVICAGYPKTGTKSMQAALTELGYNDYDAMENFAYLQDDWIKIFKEGGATEDFRRMFENVDAVTDVPAAAYWDEIHKAFPEAKIVLTMRDDEDTWAESMSHQLKAQNNRLLGLIFMLSPTYWKLKKYGDPVRNLSLALLCDIYRTC